MRHEEITILRQLQGLNPYNCCIIKCKGCFSKEIMSAYVLNYWIKTFVNMCKTEEKDCVFHGSDPSFSR